MRKFVNQLGNLFVKPLLKSPLHFLVSGSLMLITFTGRKSGKIYTTPVEYRRDSSTITVFTRKDRTWWKNLQGGAPVTLRLKGRDVRGMAEVLILDRKATVEKLRAAHSRMSEEQAAALSNQIVIVRIEVG